METFEISLEHEYLALAVSTLGEMLTNGPGLVKSVAFTRNLDGGFNVSIALGDNNDPNAVEDALSFVEAL